MAAIRFESVDYRIDSHKIIRNLTLEIPEGETLVLLGQSGSGKTTALKLINRLLIPTSGGVLVFGKNTAEWDVIELRRKIGYVIQEIGLFPHFTIRKNVSLVPRLEGWEQERIESRTREVLAMVGLEPDRFLDRYPHQLSGGQRQRVGVARALAADPGILLMDEPFGALDPITRAGIQREFFELQQRLRKTVLFVTHDVTEAFLLASRIGLMVDGCLVQTGTPEEFRNSPNPEVQEFLQPLRRARLLI